MSGGNGQNHLHLWSPELETGQSSALRDRQQGQAALRVSERAGLAYPPRCLVPSPRRSSARER